MIERLAHLARLKFSEEEKKELKTDLERMIEFVEKLKELNGDLIIDIFLILSKYTKNHFICTILFGFYSIGITAIF